MAKNVVRGADPLAEEVTEEGCEATALSKFSTAVGKLTGGAGCEDIAGIVALIDTYTDGRLNARTFCEP